MSDIMFPQHFCLSDQQESDHQEFANKIAEKMNDLVQFVQSYPDMFDTLFMGNVIYVRLPLDNSTLAAQIVLELVDKDGRDH
jgi:hypothetical protein